MGQWARQDKLNDKLGLSVNVRPQTDYWPTKKEIIDNWDAEITGNYADNQWVDIDNIESGGIMIYRRHYMQTFAVEQDIVDMMNFFYGAKSDKFDVCVVSRGGNGGKWLDWGNGFGGPGGGGQVLTFLGASFKHLWDGKSPTNTKIAKVNYGGAGMFCLIGEDGVIVGDKFQGFFINTKIGGNGGNASGSPAPAVGNNKNGTPGLGAGGEVYQINYLPDGSFNKDNPVTLISDTGPKNTAIAFDTRTDLINDRTLGVIHDAYSLGIGEFGEDYLTHAAPGHYVWRMDTENNYNLFGYKTNSIMGYGHGTTKWRGDSGVNSGGRGGGGAGGGGGGGEYSTSASPSSLDGGIPAVIVRYKGKRIFPAHKNWQIHVKSGDTYYTKTKVLGIVFEGKTYHFANKITTYPSDGATTYHTDVAPIIMDTDSFPGRFEFTAPDDFEVSRVWLAYAQTENEPDTDTHLITVKNESNLANNVLAVKMVDGARITDDYMPSESSTNEKPSISMFEYNRDNRALQYIDITDVLKENITPTNEYFIALLKGNLSIKIPAIYRSLRYVDPNNTGIPIPILKNIEAHYNNSSASVLILSANTEKVLDLEPDLYPGSLYQTFRVMDSVNVMRIYELNGRIIQEKSNTQSMVRLFFNFEIPEGYKLNFDFTQIVKYHNGTNLHSVQSKSITLDMTTMLFVPNTDVFTYRCFAPLGEFWLSEDTGNWVQKTYKCKESSDFMSIDFIAAQNLTTKRVIECRIDNNPNPADKTIKYSINLDSAPIAENDNIQITLGFKGDLNINDKYIVIGGSGTYIRYDPLQYDIINSGSAFKTDGNLGEYNVVSGILQKFSVHYRYNIDAELPYSTAGVWDNLLNNPRVTFNNGGINLQVHIGNPSNYGDANVLGDYEKTFFVDVKPVYDAGMTVGDTDFKIRMKTLPATFIYNLGISQYLPMFDLTEVNTIKVNNVPGLTNKPYNRFGIKLFEYTVFKLTPEPSDEWTLTVEMPAGKYNTLYLFDNAGLQPSFGSTISYIAIRLEPLVTSQVIGTWDDISGDKRIPVNFVWDAQQPARIDKAGVGTNIDIYAGGNGNQLNLVASLRLGRANIFVQI